MKDIISILKSDVSLFSRLYISYQTRGGDLEDFFAHENNMHPQALSQHGKMRLGTKSDLLSKCLQPLTTTTCDAPEKNALALFRTPHGKTVSDMEDKISILKSDVSLFSRLYISCQTRGGDLEDFFAHENNMNPPALSQHGKMRLGTKSNLLSKCLEPLTTTTYDAPEVDALVIDGAAIVNML
ncbi:unnamed protein product [Mytilus edulis]|uniref:Uncharacterized protein n=1 Tax=Mytilus edulis TaxID=6550 RepID=A0A8S3QEU1_MYTED|nr:unnamed protein product [Mytilus edulis]